MKFINKLFALTIIAALMLTLAACGKDKGGQNSKPDAASAYTSCEIFLNFENKI